MMSLNVYIEIELLSNEEEKNDTKFNATDKNLETMIKHSCDERNMKYDL